jgi:hypothetical protein
MGTGKKGKVNVRAHHGRVWQRDEWFEIPSHHQQETIQKVDLFGAVLGV